MKTKLNLLAAGIFLAAVNVGLTQPVITNQPYTQATAPGTTATFQVGAVGTAPLAYQWQQNPGTGFSDLTDRTNAALVLTNVQPWDATDYRVVLTNSTGARTSAVAHLYVMSPALVTSSVVIDNFDDNVLTDWVFAYSANYYNTNHQLTMRGFYPGVHTTSIHSSMGSGGPWQFWRIPDGQTREFRVDLVRIDETATNHAIMIVGDSSGWYALQKGRDYLYIDKFINSANRFCIFACERAAIPNTNVVLALALTRSQGNLLLTARVLDKADPSKVLYQRTAVDTPGADPSLSPAQFQAVTGMNLLDLGPDVAGAPVSSSGVFIGVFQYTDGTAPAVLATWDNLELWAYKVPITRYVNASSTNATPPYTNWFTAATNIQDAVDAALAGDEIVVTNGVYASGGRAVGTNLLVSRVAVDKPLTVWSVNGPEVTIIQGYQVPGTTNGDGAMRCVYLADGANLSGFTLTNGATRAVVDYSTVHRESSGGGVWCESEFTVISNCVVMGNSAYIFGGGAAGGTLDNCTLVGNSVTGELGWGASFCAGGGAGSSTLNNCTLTHNSATRGGGADSSTLNNCTVAGNSAWNHGGGAADGTLNNCTLTGNSAARGGGAAWGTLNNCTLTGNSAGAYGGGAEGSTLNNCTVTGNLVTGNEGYGFGGGVANGTLNNCTLTGNSAARGGGAVSFYMGICTLNNCIVYYNTATNGANYDQGPFAPFLNHCCTTPMPTNGVGNITNAPLFADYAGGNLRLQFNSPCINAGRNAYAPGPMDLDGLPRIVSGTVDIGAYEFQGPGSLISYAWLQHYGLPTDGSVDATDPDADGHTTWQEWRCLTDPTNALSVLRLLSASPTGSDVTVSWLSVAGVSYFLERSTNVAGPPPIFAPLATGIPGQPSTTTYTDTNAAPLAPLFYRVGVGD